MARVVIILAGNAATTVRSSHYTSLTLFSKAYVKYGLHRGLAYKINICIYVKQSKRHYF